METERGYAHETNPQSGGNDFAVALAKMARDLLAQDSIQGTLDRIVAYATELVDGCEAAGVMRVYKREVDTLAVTDNVARVSDRIQGELREGPCFDAVREQHQVYRVADMTTTEDRWPRYVPQVRQLGVGSMMGFLLYTDPQQNGLHALNLYSTRPNAFTENSELVGWLLASHAAVALASARNNANLQDAIGTRQDIGEALGIIMERYNLSEQDAFTMLTGVSQQHNTKLREIARVIVRTGEVPDRFSTDGPPGTHE